MQTGLALAATGWPETQYSRQCAGISKKSGIQIEFYLAMIENLNLKLIPLLLFTKNFKEKKTWENDMSKIQFYQL